MEEVYQKVYTKGLFIGLPCNAKCGFCNADNGFGDRFGFLHLNEKDSNNYKSFEQLKSELLGLKRKGYSTIIYEARSFLGCKFLVNLISFGKKLDFERQRFYYHEIAQDEKNYLDKLGYDEDFYHIDFSQKIYDEVKTLYGFEISKFIPLIDLKRRLDQYVKEGVKCVVYEGGDFSIYPDIFDALEYGFSLGLEQTFQTNGIKLANKGFVTRLYDCGVKDINFSLHSYKSEVSDAIMGVADGGFFKTLQAVKNCVDIGMTVSQNVVITPDNICDLDWIILQALKLKINLISFIMFIPPEDKIKEKDEIYMKKYTPDPLVVGEKISKGLQFLNEAEKIANQKLLNIKFHNIPLCLFELDTSGEREYVFDLFRRHESIEDYTQGTGFYKKEECVGCRLNNSCSGITEYYIEKFGKEYIIPIS